MPEQLALPAITASLGVYLQPEHVSFWGEEYDVQPVLVPEIFGDGAQIIGLSPLNTRPNYYVVRVDSSWSTSNHDWDKPVLIDNLEPIYQAIEEWFGRHVYECDCPHNCDDCACECGCDCPAHHQEWPAFNDEVGCEWWYIAGRYPHGRYREWSHVLPTW